MSQSKLAFFADNETTYHLNKGYIKNIFSNLSVGTKVVLLNFILVLFIPFMANFFRMIFSRASLPIFLLFFYCFPVFGSEVFSGPYKTSITKLSNGQTQLNFIFSKAGAIASFYGKDGIFDEPVISNLYILSLKGKGTDRELSFRFGGHNFDELGDLFFLGMGAGYDTPLKESEITITNRQLNYNGVTVLAKKDDSQYKTIEINKKPSHIKGAKLARLLNNSSVFKISSTRGSAALGDVPHGMINISEVGSNFEVSLPGLSNDYYLETADLDGNGFLDIIVINLDGIVSIWKNPGKKNLFKKTNLMRFNVPFSNTNDLKAVDLWGKGVKDLVMTATTGDIVVIPQQKKDGLIDFNTTKLIHFSVKKTSAFSECADLTGNGFPDIVTSYFRKPIISIIFNDGNSLSDPVYFHTGVGPYGIAIGDLNGNGLPDIATANIDNSFSILINKGNKSFLPHKTYKLLLHSFDNGYKWECCSCEKLDLNRELTNTKNE